MVLSGLVCTFVSIYLYYLTICMAKIKEGFKGERFISLPEELLERYSREPLIGNLYVRKIGFFPKVKYHYVWKKKGTNYAMLIYCVDGKGWYTIHNTRYEIEANQYIIIPPHVPYSFGADDAEPWTIYWLHFRGKLCEQFLPSHPTPQVILPGEHSRLQDRFRLFEEIYSGFSMGYIREHMIYSSMCLYPFLASFLWLEQYRSISIPNHKGYSFSSKVIHYMQENAERNLTLQELAAYFKYSPSHFSTLFHRETGVSPINFFLQLKIQKACQYIALTNMKLNEISLKLGFEEPAYFSRLFSKIMGVSPSVYRRKESERKREGEERI